MARLRIPSNHVYSVVDIRYPGADLFLHAVASIAAVFSALIVECAIVTDTSDTGPDIDTELDTPHISRQGVYGDSHSHCLADHD